MSESRDKILEKYLRVCKAAAEDDAVFATFKRHPDYHEVLEHCPVSIGNSHWANIRHDYFPETAMSKFMENDLYGSPKKYTFGKFDASPTTIQYISVLSNLITRFGSLQGMQICEIGGGYGGQAKIIKDMFRCEYDIIDLYECTLLQDKYLKDYEVKTYTNENYESKEYDLFISNYALTEVSPEDQRKYVEDICLKCKHGYITANQPLNGIESLMREFRTLKTEPDIKGERESNFLITW